MNRCFNLLLFLIIQLLIGCAKNDSCNATAPVSATDKYIYPVQPGSAEWNAAGTWGIGQFYPLDSIYKLCQVPVSKLATMSTLGLVQSLEENPCLFNMFLRSNKFQGRQEVLARLNVSWALNKRNDAGVTISSYYQSKDPNYVSCLKTSMERGAFANNWQLFDMICTQDSILMQLDKEAAKSFAKTIIEKYKIQLTYPDTYGSSKTTALLILGLLMTKQNFKPFIDEVQANSSLNSFLSSGEPVSDFSVMILDYSNRFITS